MMSDTSPCAGSGLVDTGPVLKCGLLLKRIVKYLYHYLYCSIIRTGKVETDRVLLGWILASGATAWPVWEALRAPLLVLSIFGL